MDNDNGNINCNFKKQGDGNVKAAEKGEKRFLELNQKNSSTLAISKATFSVTVR